MGYERTNASANTPAAIQVQRGNSIRWDVFKAIRMWAGIRAIWYGKTPAHVNTSSEGNHMKSPRVKQLATLLDKGSASYFPEHDPQYLHEILEGVDRLFRGNYKGYQACDT